MIFECLLIISLCLVPRLHHLGPNTFDHQLRQELCLVECLFEPPRASLLGMLFLRCSNRISIGFPGGSDGKRICLQCRRPTFDPCDPLGGSAWQPTPVFLPGNPVDRGAWRATVHGVAKRGTRLSDYHTHSNRISRGKGVKELKKRT